MNSIYRINKGINKSLEFKGLKAQYIWYLGGGLVGVMILFILLYFIGVPSLLCAAVALTAGGALLYWVYKVSHKYGEHGMMKASAARRIPKVLRLNDRQIFTGLRNKEK